MAAIGKAVVALALIWPVVLLGRIVDRFGKGIRGVPRDAMIVDAVPARDRGRAFGFHRALDTAGAVVGPLVGLGIYQTMGHRIRPVLLLALVPATISVALVARVHDHSPVAVPQPATIRIGDTRRVALPASFWRAMVPIGLFGLVNSTDALLLLRAHQVGLDATALVLVYVAYNAVYAALAYPAGRVADRLAPRAVFAAGLIVFSITYLGLGRASTSAAVWVLLPFYGVYAALTDGVSRAWIVGLVGSDQHTWALGVHGAVTGLGMLIAGLWSGLAWNGDGHLPLTVSGAVAVIVAAWLLASRPGRTGTARSGRGHESGWSRRTKGSGSSTCHMRNAAVDPATTATPSTTPATTSET